MIYLIVIFAFVLGYWCGKVRTYARVDKCERMAKELWDRHVNHD